MPRAPHTSSMATYVTRFRLAEAIAAHDPPMSQAELARRSGVSLVTVNRMANNVTAQVSLGTLGRLAVALGIAPGDLIATIRAPEPAKRRPKA